MTSAAVDVTVIIVNYNTGHLLDEAIGKLRQAARDLSLQIILVDNASRDDSVARMRRDFADCERIENASNVGFGRANNQALAMARGKYVLLLNTDAFVVEGDVGRTVQFLESHPKIGLVGVRLVGSDGALQPSCRYFPTPWNTFLTRTGLNKFFPRVRLVDDMAWGHDEVRDCDWVPGCYYLVRKEVTDRVGLFDPRYFLYFEEVDHCRAVKAAGFGVAFFPDTTVLHIGGASAETDSEVTPGGRQISALQIESGHLYFRKHFGRSGAWLNAFLVSAGDAYLAAKWLWRRRTLRGLTPLWANTVSSWSSFHKTAWGNRATR